MNYINLSQCNYVNIERTLNVNLWVIFCMQHNSNRSRFKLLLQLTSLLLAAVTTYLVKYLTDIENAYVIDIPTFNS